MNSIELFAGIGGFRIACEELNINTIWSNDIDEKSSIVYKSNWNDNSFVRGDVWKMLDTIPPHNLLTAGFPCQPFSSAGKKQGIRDPRGTLFQAIVEIIKTHSPNYFVLENVKRLLSMENGQHFATIIDSLSSLGYLVEWRVLNAVNFGLPQHRERVVIIGTKISESLNSYLLSYSDFESIKNKNINIISKPEEWIDISKHKRFFENWGLALNNKFVNFDIKHFSEKKNIIKLHDILESNVDDSYFFQEETVARLNTSKRVDKFYNGVEIIYNQSGGARMGYTIFGTNGISPTLTSSSSRHYERYLINNKFRRLTNVEYARIQGFPDNHSNSVSAYNQYKLYGNAVPPQLVKWVINRLVNNIKVDLPKQLMQGELFYEQEKSRNSKK